MAKAFSTIQTELAFIWQDTAFASLKPADQTSLKLRINLAKDYIISWPKQFDKGWPFCQTTAYIATTAEYDTGTIALTQYDQTVTGTGVYTGMEGRVLVVASGTEPYRIASITDTDEFELETPYLHAADATASYNIVRDLYSLPTDFNGIVRNTVKPDGEDRLTFLSQEIFDKRYPESTNIGIPDYYGFHDMIASGASKGRRQIWFREEYPETVMGIQYQYYKMIDDLDDAADISLIGYVQGGDNALLITSIWQLREMERDSWTVQDIAAAKADADQAIAVMWANNRSMSEDAQKKEAKVDSRVGDLSSW